jgi:hypothetical protein
MAKMIIIPLTIDDSSPEAQKRSLWGMVNWSLWSMQVYDTGDVFIRLRNSLNYSFDCKTLTEAILRALCSQEGME